MGNPTCRSTRLNTYELFTSALVTSYFPIDILETVEAVVRSDGEIMSTEILKQGTLVHMPKLLETLRNHLLGSLVCSIGAALGIFGGIAFIVFGLLCVVIQWMIGRDTVLDNVGAFMLIVAIPMMMLGAAFMDEYEKKK